jgi:NhaP-type Na+/H+ and K+/H+ antiporter
MKAPKNWTGKKLSTFLPERNATPAIIFRGGQSLLPTPETVVEDGDILQLSATIDGASALRALIHAEQGKE